MQSSRVLGFGSLVLLGAVIAACGGGGTSTPAGESDLSQRAIESTNIQAGATPPPEDADPLEAAVVNTLIAMAAQDGAALNALAASPFSEAEITSALACTRGTSSAKITSQTPTVTGTTASVQLELQMSLGMSIKRPKPVWEYTQVGEEWKLAAPPTCVLN
ncbi:MAG: hypothetical protein O2919_04785 [Chloroflexi bacterium]|nr:hypothetical protein [Chloroflexota bacterium]